MVQRGGIVQEIGSELQSDPELGSLAERASAFLGTRAANTFVPTKAVWALHTHLNQKLIRVKLSDTLDDMEVLLSPQELKTESRLENRMSQIWGDKLERRSDIMIDRIFDNLD